MTQSSYDLTELIFYAMAAITSGILSGALTIGLLPFFEIGIWFVIGYEINRIIES